MMSNKIIKYSLFLFLLLIIFFISLYTKNPWQFEYQLNAIGKDKGNVEQSFTIINDKKEIFSQRVCEKINSCIDRYKYDLSNDSNILTAIDTMNPSYILGHQGLSYQKIDGDQFLLWSSANQYHVENNGHYAVQFFYNPNANLERFKLYKLFDNNFNIHGSTTPAISTDGKYLVARGYKNELSIIRVWDIDKLLITDTNSNIVDFSDQYISEFIVDKISSDKQYPIQGVASNGKYIYLLLGSYSIKHNKLLLTYSLNGELINKEEITVGKEKAIKESKSQHWEAEGISIINDRLFIMIVSGKAKNRINRIYSRKID